MGADSMNSSVRLFFLTFLFFNGCFGKEHQSTNTHSPVYVSIFVHGTHLLAASAVSLKSTMQDKLDDNKLYIQTIKNTRRDPRFYDGQIMLEEGLIPIKKEIFAEYRLGKLSTETSRRGAIDITF